MKKKLFTLLVCAFAWIGVNASVSGPDANGFYTLTAPIESSDLSGIASATALKLVGNFTDGDLTSIKEALNNNLTKLNLKEASIPETSQLTGKLKLGLQSLIMPGVASYTTIPEGFCNGISSLTYIELPDNIIEIGKYAFQSTGITSIDLPSNLQYIRAQAFNGTPLTEITIPGL